MNKDKEGQWHGSRKIATVGFICRKGLAARNSVWRVWGWRKGRGRGLGKGHMVDICLGAHSQLFHMH